MEPILPKTLDMLAAIPAGTFIPDGEPCYDPAEVEALAAVLRRLVYAPSQIRRALEQAGVSIVPAGLSSPVPGIAELSASFDPPLRLDAVFDPASLIDTLEWLAGFADEFDPPPDSPLRIESADALATYAFVRRHQPRTILAIGSGAVPVAHEAVQRNGLGRILCVGASTDHAEPIEGGVPTLPPEFLNDTLEDGDFLLVETSHAVKHGSDCVHLYLRLLPGLRRSVLIQVQDIFLPETLLLEEMRDLQRHWTEQYLLYALLVNQPRMQVVYSSHWHALHNLERLERFMNGKAPAGGGSLWIKHLAE